MTKSVTVFDELIVNNSMHMKGTDYANPTWLYFKRGLIAYRLQLILVLFFKRDAGQIIKYNMGLSDKFALVETYGPIPRFKIKADTNSKPHRWIINTFVILQVQLHNDFAV